jgi:hypothetical protein
MAHTHDYVYVIGIYTHRDQYVRRIDAVLTTTESLLRFSHTGNLLFSFLKRSSVAHIVFFDKLHCVIMRDLLEFPSTILGRGHITDVVIR